MVTGSNPRTISGWTYIEIRVHVCYHFMSFIETNVVDTDMSQVRPARWGSHHNVVGEL